LGGNVSFIVIMNWMDIESTAARRHNMILEKRLEYKLLFLGELDPAAAATAIAVDHRGHN
jgi:hypothetical protein